MPRKEQQRGALFPRNQHRSRIYNPTLPMDPPVHKLELAKGAPLPLSSMSIHVIC